jgi:hypothetical protein
MWSDSWSEIVRVLGAVAYLATILLTSDVTWSEGVTSLAS